MISDAFAEIQVEDKAAAAKKEAAEAGLEAAQEKFIKGGSELRLNCLLRKVRVMGLPTISTLSTISKYLQYLGHGASSLHLLVPQQDDG